MDIFREKINPALQPDAIIDIYKKFKPKRMRIETTGYQEALRQTVRKTMMEQNLYISGLEKGIKPRNKKSERLISLVPMLAKGEFYFRPKDLAAQQEFLSYPKGKHDDVLDAIFYALDGHYPCRVKREGFENVPIKTHRAKVLDWLTM